MRKNVFLIFSVFLIVSMTSGCVSGNKSIVPGVQGRVTQNINTEYYSIAEGYVALKNYTKAAEYYRLAMRDKDLYMMAYYKMGRSYALAKDWNNALPVFETLLKRDPDNGDLAASLAYITAMNGDVSDALLQYKSLITRYPDNQSLLENYIALLIFDGKGELAEGQLIILRTKFPDSKQITSFSDKIAGLVDAPEQKSAEQPAPPKPEN